MMNTYEKIASLEEELAKLKAETKRYTRFEPKENEYYAFINSLGQAMTTTPFALLDSRTKFNNVFRKSSKDNLKKYSHDVLTVQNRLMQLHEELCPDYWPNWSDNQAKAAVLFYHNDNRWGRLILHKDECCTVVFTPKAAEEACKILNAEKFLMSVEVSECER